MSHIPAFSLYEVDVEPQDGRRIVPAFFVESTAPDNIDDRDSKLGTPNYCKPSTIDDIVEILAQQQNPKLVITVHGFNTPRPRVLETYKNSFEAVNHDDAIRDSGVVCIGFRWPSERIGTPWFSGISAAPLFLIGVLATALAIFYLVNFYFEICGWGKLARIVLTAITAAMVIVPITLFLLRMIAYFRDQFRAATYGVPDLVTLVCQIDDKLFKALNSHFAEAEYDTGRRADLSFICHSMGGFVVTNAVRILSDVFSPQVLSVMKYGVKDLGTEDERQERELRSKIGKSFLLRSLVLVAPDIPAEVLLLSRSNALQSSLIRFREAHLFSNEGDEVLRDISTIANFFSLPTKKRRFGSRLGNVGVPPGWWGVSESLELSNLRVGSHKLADLYDELHVAQSRESFAQRLTYFDCTDSIDEKGQGVVTDATPGAPPNLSWLGHLRLLLWVYLAGKADVHSGYFLKHTLVHRLIYRFACIGYGDTEKAYNGPRAFSDLCKQAQIKALKAGASSVAEASARDKERAVVAQ